jgi:hypothetical protein
MKKTYTIIAKRWFERVNGNTYHSVTIYHDATLLDRVPINYGYGSHYEQTALEMLQKLGIAGPETTVFWKWKEEYGRDKVLVICEDVKRKKDL